MKILLCLLFVVGAGLAQEKATLNIEAALILNSGKAQPAARARFWLFDADVREIGMNARLEHPMPETLPLYRDAPTHLLGAMLLYTEQSSPNFHKQAQAILKPHQIAAMDAGFDGKATVTAKPGKYWLAGSYHYPPTHWVLWYQVVEVKPEQQRLLLDQSSVVAHR